ncbi:zinc finger CCCH-type protein [Fadolivirus algeromassiliense]|jgi:hypothetical protein|uniref:Zinc finger CCCH-type protein n=1 Tax=Fadolivirus FV1/VV64 TaxID=3070911 RepID=A0A7D3V8P6_9VIRU|nr:zinc finger CCCH-type protein [Fadolivirus algeromassiliense]QKF93877.1 zinc finger CCCH-type protein [Fadolivirus FV1/VV64]
MFPNDKKNNDNSKKILCVNIINKIKCNYGNKCMYAHSLNEQKIEPLRHKVYTIIKCADDLSNIDLVSDPKLYETLLQLTRVCMACSKGQCPGGYNCRNGAVSIKSKICYEDLVYGNCKKNNCTSVHLTDRGLVPYYKQKNKELKQNDNSNNKYSDGSDESYNNIYYKKNKYVNYKKQLQNPKDKSNKLKEELDNIKGILLTDTFLLSKFGTKQEPEDDDSSSEKQEDIDKMIEYLNHEDNDSDEESIFLV